MKIQETFINISLNTIHPVRSNGPYATEKEHLLIIPICMLKHFTEYSNIHT